LTTDTSIDYENTPVRLVSLRKIQRIETPGYALEEVDERREFTAPFWVGRVLVDAGLARLGEEWVTGDEWTQIHFKERFNPGGPPAPLPKGFYPRVYLSLNQLAKEAAGDQTRVDQLNRLKARFRDILESRIGKITRLASSESAPQPGVFQPEEQRLYEEVQELISSWRRDMRGLGAR
jgi:hypothetical protein